MPVLYTVQVCFGMFMPTLVRTFLYVVPKSTNRVLDFFMWLVSRELHVTTTFCRWAFGVVALSD